MPHQVLLLFKKGVSREITSPHDGEGELHLAFAISAAELANWESWLAQKGIAVEEKRAWDWVAGAFTFAMSTDTCSNSPGRASGLSFRI